jgi:hypothetical protein
MSGNNPVKGSSSIFRFALNFFKKTNLTCRWSVSVAPPATDVYIQVDSDKDIDSTTAEIFIFQLLNGQEIPITYLTAPVEEKRYVNYRWRTQPAKGGEYEAGEYHFRVNVDNNQAETVKPLKLKDVVARRYESSFEDGKKKGPVNIKG